MNLAEVNEGENGKQLEWLVKTRNEAIPIDHRHRFIVSLLNCCFARRLAEVFKLWAMQQTHLDELTITDYVQKKIAVFKTGVPCLHIVHERIYILGCEFFVPFQLLRKSECAALYNMIRFDEIEFVSGPFAVSESRVYEYRDLDYDRETLVKMALVVLVQVVMMHAGDAYALAVFEHTLAVLRALGLDKSQTIKRVSIKMYKMWRPTDGGRG